MMESDDGVRPKHGIVVGLLELDDGTCRIVIDDVKSEAPRRDTKWAFEGFYTHKRFESKAFTDMSLPDADFQAIGVAIVARLLALNNQRG